MSNRASGNKFEKEFCNILKSHGYWVHNMAQNSAGQPADIIAVKGGKAFLIDCKVCKSDHFPLSRVEDNQKQAMSHWKKCGNSNPYFALKMDDGTIYMVPFFVTQIETQLGHRSISKEVLAKCDKLQWWLGVIDRCLSE